MTPNSEEEPAGPFGDPTEMPPDGITSIHDDEEDNDR